VPWPCNREQVHRPLPEERAIWSYGSGYGGNALLGKKCFALRIASMMAREEGWLAEHMLILGVENPAGREDLRRGGVPERVRQDELRHADPARGFDGWKVTTVGDDIAWIKEGADGGSTRSTRRPASSASRRAPRTKSNPNAMATIAQHDLHQRGAHAGRRRLVGGHDADAAAKLIDWRGNRWTPGLRTPRRTRTRASPRPARSARPSIPSGRTRRACRSARSSSAAAAPANVPLVYQAFNWTHGVYLAATMGSEMTAAAAGQGREVRRDPFAMLPFCGYHMGDYFNHWLTSARAPNPPRIFM
jgi:phosphoenolpyruvate carboxykinase (GTP)